MGLEEAWRYAGHWWACAVSLSASGKVAYVGANRPRGKVDGSVHRLEEGQPTGRWGLEYGWAGVPPRNELMAVATMADGDGAVAGFRDQVVRLAGDGSIVWRSPWYELVSPINLSTTRDASLTLIAAGRLVALGLRGDTVWTYQQSTNIFRAAMDSNGADVYAADPRRGLLHLDKDGNLQQTMSPWTRIRALAVSADGTSIICGISGHEVIGLTPNGDTQWRMRVAGNPASASLCGDGSVGVVSTTRRRLYLIAGGRTICVVKTPHASSQVAIAEDGSLVAVATWPGVVAYRVTWG